MKFILVRTDGYSIKETGRYPNHHDAHEAMKHDYADHNTNSPDSEWLDMSGINENDAVLYNNGEDVYVWHIIAV